MEQPFNDITPINVTDSWVPGLPLDVTIGVGITSFLASVIYALTGFGNAIIMHIGWQLMFLVIKDESGIKDDMVEVVVLNHFIGLVGFIPMLWVCRKTIPLRLVFVVLPPTIIFGFIGTWALFVIPNDVAKFVLGAVFLAFGAWKALQELKNVPAILNLPCCAPSTRLRKIMDFLFPDTSNIVEPSTSELAPKYFQSIPIIRDFCTYASWRSYSLAVMIGGFVAASLGGFLRGLYGVGGPPLFVWIAIARLDKSAIRGLSNGINFISTPLLASFLFFGQGALKKSYWVVYLVVVVTTALGLVAGNRLYSHVDSVSLLRIIIMLLILASIVMFSPPFWVELTAFGILLVATVIYFIWRMKTSRGSSEDGLKEVVPTKVDDEPLSLQEDPETSLLNKESLKDEAELEDSSDSLVELEELSHNDDVRV